MSENLGYYFDIDGCGSDLPWVGKGPDNYVAECGFSVSYQMAEAAQLEDKQLGIKFLQYHRLFHPDMEFVDKEHPMERLSGLIATTETTP